jgi:hypothetical protein
VRYRMRIGGTGLVLAAFGVLAAGCGGTSDTPAASDQPGFAAYTACLAKNGVTLTQNSAGPGGGVGASGRPEGRASTRPSGEPGMGQPGGSGLGGGGVGGGFSTAAPAGVDQAAWQKAQDACASLRPTARPGRSGSANNSAMTAYRNCLSEHGVTASTGTNQLNSADPTVAAAMSACAPLRPTGRPNPTPTS